MHNVFFLLIAVGVVLVGLLGIGIYQLMSRPRSDEGIDEFRSARDALAVFHDRHHEGGRSGVSGNRRGN